MSGSLAGLRVVNTRAPHQAAELDRALIAAGAIPLAFPCIDIDLLVDSSELDAALGDLASGAFDWLAFTSANTVHAVAQGLSRSGGRARARIAAVGPATANAVASDLGIGVDVIPNTHTAEHLAMAIPIVAGDRVLLPASEIAGRELEDLLIARGATVTRVTAYRTVAGSGGIDLPSLLVRGEVDALAFASSSAVEGFIARLGDGDEVRAIALDLPAACIGPNTGDTASRLGFRRVNVAGDQSISGLITAIESVCVMQPKGGKAWL